MDKVDNDQIQSAFGKACMSMRFYQRQQTLIAREGHRQGYHH